MKLLEAAKCGNVSALQESLQTESIDVNYSDPYGKTALMWAASNGHHEAIQVLLKCKNIDLCKQDKDGQTAIMLASKGGHCRAVQELISIDNSTEENHDGVSSTNLVMTGSSLNQHGKFMVMWLTNQISQLQSRFEQSQAALVLAEAQLHNELLLKRLLPGLSSTNSSMNTNNNQNENPSSSASDSAYAAPAVDDCGINSFPINEVTEMDSCDQTVTACVTEANTTSASLSSIIETASDSNLVSIATALSSSETLSLSPPPPPAAVTIITYVAPQLPPLLSFGLSGGSNTSNSCSYHSGAAGTHVCNAAMDEIIQILQPQVAQVQYRASVVNMLDGLIRATLSCVSYETGFYKFRCFLPDDPIKVSAVLCRNHATKWHRSVCDRLQTYSKRRLEDGDYNNNNGRSYGRNLEDCDGNEENLSMNTHSIKNVIISNTKLCIQVQCVVDTVEVEVSCNSRIDMCLLYLLEEIARLVGRNNLFKRSLLLIRAWWLYETAALIGGSAVGAAAAASLGANSVHHYLSDTAVAVMVAAIFNQYHTHITTPLQALCAFLAEYSAYDGTTHAITLQGIVPFKSNTSNQPVVQLPPLPPVSTQFQQQYPLQQPQQQSPQQQACLVSLSMLQQHWLLHTPASEGGYNFEQHIQLLSQQQQDKDMPSSDNNIAVEGECDSINKDNLSSITNASITAVNDGVDEASATIRGEIAIDPNVKIQDSLASHRMMCTKNIAKFDRGSFNIVNPITCSNMVSERPTQNRVLKLSKVFQAGAANMNSILQKLQHSSHGAVKEEDSIGNQQQHDSNRINNMTTGATDPASAAAAVCFSVDDVVLVMQNFFPVVYTRFGETVWRPDCNNSESFNYLNSSSNLTRKEISTLSVMEDPSRGANNTGSILINSVPTSVPSNSQLLLNQVHYCNLMIDGYVSRSGVLNLCSDVLTQKGPLPIGEVGKALAELTCISGLSLQLKEKYGGLKKFLEENADNVIIGTDHPFNPHVILRNSLSAENLALVDNGIYPANAINKMKKNIAAKKLPIKFGAPSFSSGSNTTMHNNSGYASMNNYNSSGLGQPYSNLHPQQHNQNHMMNVAATPSDVYRTNGIAASASPSSSLMHGNEGGGNKNSYHQYQHHTPLSYTTTASSAGPFSSRNSGSGSDDSSSLLLQQQHQHHYQSGSSRDTAQLRTTGWPPYAASSSNKLLHETSGSSNSSIGGSDSEYHQQQHFGRQDDRSAANISSNRSHGTNNAEEDYYFGQQQQQYPVSSLSMPAFPHSSSSSSTISSNSMSPKSAMTTNSLSISAVTSIDVPLQQQQQHHQQQSSLPSSYDKYLPKEQIKHSNLLAPLSALSRPDRDREQQLGYYNQQQQQYHQQSSPRTGTNLNAGRGGGGNNSTIASSSSSSLSSEHHHHHHHSGSNNNNWLSQLDEPFSRGGGMLEQDNDYNNYDNSGSSYNSQGVAAAAAGRLSSTPRQHQQQHQQTYYPSLPAAAAATSSLSTSSNMNDQRNSNSNSLPHRVAIAPGSSSGGGSTVQQQRHQQLLLASSHFEELGLDLSMDYITTTRSTSNNSIHSNSNNNADYLHSGLGIRSAGGAPNSSNFNSSSLDYYANSSGGNNKNSTQQQQQQPMLPEKWSLLSGLRQGAAEYHSNNSDKVYSNSSNTNASFNMRPSSLSNSAAATNNSFTGFHST